MWHDCLEPSGLNVIEGVKGPGVTCQALNNLVNGKASISLEMAVRLAKVCGRMPKCDCGCRWPMTSPQVRVQKVSAKPIAHRALRDDLHPCTCLQASPR